jgi:hypothetical protein
MGTQQHKNTKHIQTCHQIELAKYLDLEQVASAIISSPLCSIYVLVCLKACSAVCYGQERLDPHQTQPIEWLWVVRHCPLQVLPPQYRQLGPSANSLQCSIRCGGEANIISFRIWWIWRSRLLFGMQNLWEKHKRHKHATEAEEHQKSSEELGDGNVRQCEKWEKLRYQGILQYFIEMNSMKLLWVYGILLLDLLPIHSGLRSLPLSPQCASGCELANKASFVCSKASVMDLTWCEFRHLFET